MNNAFWKIFTTAFAISAGLSVGAGLVSGIYEGVKRIVRQNILKEEDTCDVYTDSNGGDGKI